MKLVADNIRITKKEIRTALETKTPGPIRALAAQCVERGADAIDINAGPLARSPETAMAFFVESVAAVTGLPLFIDTVNPRAMAAALSAAPNPMVLNGISLEPAKLDHILPLAKEYETDLVGFLLDEQSRVPRTSEEQLDLALRLTEAVTAAGIPKERLIIDPVVPPLSWDDGLFRAREVVATIRLLPELLGFPVRTIAGLSNLTTGAGSRKKKACVESAYLAMLSWAGLTYIMLDIFGSGPVGIAKACGILTKEEIFSWEQIPL